MKYSIAILGALMAQTNAMRLSDSELYPWGSPYSFSEQQSTNKEVQEAWETIENRKVLAEAAERKTQEETEEAAKLEEWNQDILHPSHIQGRKYEIEESFVQTKAEPPSKNAGTTEEPTMGEEEGKGKELSEANAESAKFQAQKAADAAAEAAASAAKAKEEEDKVNLRPDGNLHKDGKRHFVDGVGEVGGVNNY